ncbi:MAG: FHA domain-containing protein [Acidimicrobiales bacterium]
MRILAAALDNQNFLRAVEIVVVALVWLFFLRVIRAVWVEVRPPRLAALSADVAVAPPPPAPGRRARSAGRGRSRLRIVEPESQRGEVFEIPDDEVTIGRAAGCGVCVEDTYTSNIHARLFRRDAVLWIEDLGSTNGTWVNAVRLERPMALSRGDLVQVGGTVFEVTR